MILQGDALTKLKELKEKSVNMVMTSPPYWALRDYGSDVETIWDGDENCKHEFEVKERRLHGGTMKEDFGCSRGTREMTDWKTKDGFCQKCGAWKGQLGLEPTFDLYIKHLCDIFDEVKRVLRDDGTCWVNLGDTYYSKSGGKFQNDNISNKQRNDASGISKANKLKEGKELEQKNLTLIPFRFAIEMQNRGWILRNVIIWHKPNCMPSSVKDRFTVDFEYIFFFSKKKKYYFEQQLEPVKLQSIHRTKYKWEGHREKMSAYEGMDIKNMCKGEGRNKRAVWEIKPKGFKEAHFAVYPEKLCETPIKAGCPKDGIVLDPFFGAGTTGLVALKQGKKFIGIELNPEYIEIAKKRLAPYKEQTKLNFLKVKKTEIK